METWIISDTHFGHKSICKFLREDGTKLRPWDNVDEMDAVMIQRWNDVVKPRDTVYHLGDVVMNRHCLETVGKLNGNKKLIMGNHDNFDHSEYLQYFSRLHGSMKLDGMLLTHIPIHQDSSRWCLANVHGHIHSQVIPDPRYYNVSVEQIDYQPQPLYLVKENIIRQQQLSEQAKQIVLDLM